MFTKAGSILLVDDDPALLSVLSRYFEAKGLEVHQALTAHEGGEVYELQRPDVVLLDLMLPDMSGLSLLERLRHQGATVVMLTACQTIPTAVQAMKAGAEDFLTKPVELHHLGVIVDRALERARLRRLQLCGGEIDEIEPLASLGRSPRMRAVAAQILQVAEQDRTTVLLLGETGTGKGWVARRIHQLSGRRNAPFVEINCATLTGTFLESELFGHEKGAFTDAKTVKRGLFEVADTGTVLLDEISHLDIHLQPKLLTILDSSTFRRMGGTREIQVDVRLIAACNDDLRLGVARNLFRADLFYRLNVMPVQLPPLRRRSPADVAELAQRIMADLQRQAPGEPRGISSAALERLVSYEWPGNIRELRNILERARIVAGTAEVLGVEHLSLELRPARGTADPGGKLPTLKELDQHHIERVLAHCKGNRKRAAQLLGISRTTLHNKIRQYHLETTGR